MSTRHRLEVQVTMKYIQYLLLRHSVLEGAHVSLVAKPGEVNSVMFLTG
ncbi:Uncharacterised protein [Bacillus freudenreichii]|nr:Uncharacterised protein [Bacillus freudenreichii]